MQKTLQGYSNQLQHSCARRPVLGLLHELPEERVGDRRLVDAVCLEGYTMLYRTYLSHFWQAIGNERKHWQIYHNLPGEKVTAAQKVSSAPPKKLVWCQELQIAHLHPL